MSRGNERSSRLERASTEAVFRYSLVSQIEALTALGWTLSDAVDAVSSTEHLHPTGRLESVHGRTLYRWLKAWREHAMQGLEPQPRQPRAPSLVLPAALIEFLRTEREQDPRASIPELIARAEQKRIIAKIKDVDRTTVWRVMQRMGLETRPQRSKQAAKCRRFGYPHRMMLVMADGKHFRAGAARLKRVALFFIDDATRKALGVVVTTSENAADFLRGLWEIIRRYGFMIVIYLDRGPGFIADDTWRVIADLPGVTLVHGRAKYPQGRGKLERFNQTVDRLVLCGVDGAVDVDPSCEALRLRLEHALELYNHQPHEALGGETPAARWDRDERALRFPESEASLRERFLLSESRVVSADHIVKLDSVEYEVPYGVIPRSTIELYRHVFDGTVSIIHDGRRIALAPVDKVANAVSRERGHHHQPLASHDTTPKTAATLAYERDFAPIVGPDGGFDDEV